MTEKLCQLCKATVTQRERAVKCVFCEKYRHASQKCYKNLAAAYPGLNDPASGIFWACENCRGALPHTATPADELPSENGTELGQSSISAAQMPNLLETMIRKIVNETVAAVVQPNAARTPPQGRIIHENGRQEHKASSSLEIGQEEDAALVTGLMKAKNRMETREHITYIGRALYVNFGKYKVFPSGPQKQNGTQDVVVVADKNTIQLLIQNSKLLSYNEYYFKVFVSSYCGPVPTDRKAEKIAGLRALMQELRIQHPENRYKIVGTEVVQVVDLPGRNNA